MAKYYYKRYSAKPQYSKSNQHSYYYSSYNTLPDGKVYECEITNESSESAMVSESLLCDPDTGYYAYSRAELIDSNIYLQHRMYLVISSATEAWTVVGNGYTIPTAHTMGNGVKRLSEYTITPTYVAGELIEELIAEDGTYPDDGYNEGDGYYYVKDRMAIQFFTRINGAWVETRPRARIAGAWKQVYAHPRIGGAWIG